MEKKTKIIIISGAVVVVIAALVAVYFLFIKVTMEYNQSVRVADDFFNTQKYQEARVNYNQAMDLKPSAEYPKQQLKKVNQAIDQQEAAKKYNKAITQADDLYDKNDFEKSKEAYQNASSILPEEQYPKDRIAEINKILDKARQDAEWENYKYHVIVGSFMEPSNANRMNRKLKDKGLKSRIIVINEGRMQAVSYSSHPNLKEAVKALADAKSVVSEDEPWVLIH